MQQSGMILFVVMAGLQLGMAKDPCEVSIKVMGKTVESCAKNAQFFLEDQKFATCQSTAWMTEVRQQESDCTKKVMNQSLDVRLLRLKKDNKQKTQFQNEMEIQKHFLKGVEDLCLRQYESCQGSMWTSVGAGCATPFYRSRHREAELINHGQLELVDGTPAADTAGKLIEPGTELKDYAKKLCHLPSDVWKGQQAPVDCEKKTLKRFRVVVPSECAEESEP